MKNSPKILKAIRAAFSGFRWLFALLAIVAAVKLVVGPKAITGTLTLAPGAQALATIAGQSSQVVIHTVKATVTVPVTSQSDAELSAVARAGIIPTILVVACAGFVICEFARRLTRNFETGELFSTTNAKLLQSTAVVLVAATVVARLLTDWSNHLFAQYAIAHLTLSGAHPLPLAENVMMPELTLNLGNADLLVLALFVLVVVAFRHGVALKQENDLTI